jgi:hypothetical protein
MDFSKLKSSSSSKRTTKLSKKAQASVDQSQLKAKRKNINEEDSLAPSKKGRVTQPDGTSRTLPNLVSNSPRPSTETQSMRTGTMLSLTSSSGSVADEASPTQPSDSDRRQSTTEMDDGSVGNMIEVPSESDDEDGWADESEASPKEELGLFSS